MKEFVMVSLFSPLSIKSMNLRNRVVFPPIATNYGLRNDRACHYYTERARGGAGLVILQGTPIDLLTSPEWIAGLKQVVNSVHAEGAAIGIQLWMGNELPDGNKVAPSRRYGCREVSAAELETIAERFSHAARATRDLGFDTIDVHGAHGYFLHQFFSPLTNQREDNFGGSLKKRISFPLMCVRAIRAEVGDDFPIMYRLSAVEFAPGGITLEDSIFFSRELAQAGVDILDVSAGGQLDDFNITSPDAKQPLGTHANLAGAIKQVVSVPVLAVGRFNNLEICEDVLKQGKADLIAVGRQLLADPYWPKKLQEGRQNEVIACKSCNVLCQGNYIKDKPIECVVNKELGREYLRYEKNQQAGIEK
jgi:2,4-dienoyl-CoA reductase-like NADH-dependent reductase (Old Yellow Enzyme family)